ncbi:MAG: chorismate--pyruvate lyase family protein [Vogesella sp.]|uniref:chorismate--pyruvate lyase family protein n=1 Tax=Vogesella sp. TaxID=1904252 RepID=UPI003F2AECD4
MPRMDEKQRWSATLPACSPLLAACMATRGSLTEHLMATGHPFAVDVLAQGHTAIYADEAELLQISAKQPVYARHVRLMLNGEAVVIARSITLQDSQAWRPILERGSRSLGLTLFGGLPGLGREALQFLQTAAPHPLHILASAHDTHHAPQLGARRCRFTLANSPLLVSEVFLPALENYLR